MNELVFYCAHCDQTFSGEAENGGRIPNCPQCQRKTLPTGITKESWLTYSAEERRAILNNLAKENEENEARNREHAARRERFAEQVGADYQEQDEEKENSFLDELYSNIGRKLQVLAQIVFVVEALASVLGGMIMLIGGLWFGILVTIFGALLAWISSWTLYAFGELVDKTVANEKNTRNILKILLENSTKNNN